MPVRIELCGQTASPGIAAGPLVRLEATRTLHRAAHDKRSETSALLSAIAIARDQLAGLASISERDAADIIDFQIALLEDESLLSPILEAIDSGSVAGAAWAASLDAEISSYRSAGDEYFSARAADFLDLRDRILRILSGDNQRPHPPGVILVGDDISPTVFLEFDWGQGGGLVIKNGSATSHVAILARARGIPMVVGIGNADLDGHREAIVYGGAGRVILSPSVSDMEHATSENIAAERGIAIVRQYLRRPACTADGTPVKVLVNVERPDDLTHIDAETCDGIGLMRTEFLFSDGKDLPDEETQYNAYRRLLEWAGDKPVTIRTFDIGGDKPVRGLTIEGEANPFLGVRGLRLALARPDVLSVQLRALARLAPGNQLRVMWPMVTAPNELVQGRVIFDREVALLQANGVPAALPQLGMMVEVPVPAIMPELFETNFLSIGSNDLVQYLAAASRDNPAVAGLAEAAFPVTLKLISGLALFAKQRGVDLSICGDLASETDKIPALLRAGLRSLSVTPAALGAVKAAIANVNLGTSQ